MPSFEILEILLESIFVFSFIRLLSKYFHLVIPLLPLLAFVISLALTFNDARILIFGAIALVISEIDRIELRIPDILTKPAILLLSISLIDSVRIIAVAWLWLWAMYVLTFFAPGVIGRGDVKLIAALILLYGLCTEGSVLSFLFLLCALSSLFALPEAVLAWRRERERHFPFGPGISGAALVLFAIAP